VILDPLSLHLAAFLVILVSALMFLLDTLMLNNAPAGRYWSAAFLSGSLSAVCYLIAMLVPGAFLANAIGNGVFVGATGLIWLGCLAFNGRRTRVPALVWAAGVLVVILAAAIPGPASGDWAGAVPLFVGNAVFGALGAIETRRGAVRGQWSAAGLTAVLGIESLWFVARTVVFVAWGPDSAVFRGFFDPPIVSLLTITLVVAAVVVTSTLRSGTSALRESAATRTLTVSRDGILLRGSFRVALNVLLQRARAAGEDPCVVCLRIDDLRRVAAAFDPEEADAILTAFRTAVRRHAPTMALVGETDTTGVTVAFIRTAVTDVRAATRSLHDRVVADVSALGTSVVPVVGTGIALAEDLGFDAERLIAHADADAARAVVTGEQPFGLS